MPKNTIGLRFRRTGRGLMVSASGGGVGCSRCFAIGVGVHCRRSGVLGVAGDPVAVNLEVAPWVCLAAPRGHRPGIDRRRVEPRLGIDSRAHHPRYCILGGHNGRGVARDNGRGNFTARAVGPRRRRLDLTKSRRTHIRAVYSRHLANSATASGAPRATCSNERASLPARACSMTCTHRRRWYLIARVDVRGANTSRDDDDPTSGAAVARPTAFGRRLSRGSAAKVLHSPGPPSE